ncbi:MAG: acyl carrier protein [Chlamydiales bacterium]|nr:acyl carrier protein [Chlamydiales bacterium]
MNKQEIFEKISDYLVEYFEIPKENITLEANFYTDLDLDSIDAIDLLVKLQDITHKKVAPADFKEVRTVGDLIELVYKIINS